MNDTQIESHIICRWMSFDDKTKLLRSTCLFFVFRRGFEIVIGLHCDLTVEAYAVFAVGVLIMLCCKIVLDLNLCFKV
jgi:hypothetical protein